MKWYKAILVCFAIFVLLSGCATDHASNGIELPAGLLYSVDDLMQPTFFDQDPSAFQSFFPRPSRAVYIHDGIQDEIPADDSKINRLMNILEFSMENSKTIWLQGLVPEEEAEEWKKQTVPILAISFPEDSQEKGYESVTQIIVCGSECLIYFPEQFESSYIEEHWPCAQYLRDLKDAGTISEKDYHYYIEHARESPWLNLLTYCGFHTQGT